MHRLIDRGEAAPKADEGMSESFCLSVCLLVFNHSVSSQTVSSQSVSRQSVRQSVTQVARISCLCVCVRVRQSDRQSVNIQSLSK